MKWYWWILLAIMVGYAAQGCTECVTDMCITEMTGDVVPKWSRALSAKRMIEVQFLTVAPLSGGIFN